MYSWRLIDYSWSYHIIFNLGILYYCKSWEDNYPQLFRQKGSLLSMNFNETCFYMLFCKNR
jgi:hypothetical protein